MLLRIFKSNHPFLLILMAFIAVALWLPVILNPEWKPVYQSGTQLYRDITTSIMPNYWYQQLLALLLVIIEAYFLIRLNFKYIFIETKTYLPTVFFIFITAVFAKQQQMLPVMLANAFFLLAIDRSFELGKDSNQFKRYFESGFFIGFGSLFYNALTFYTILVIFTLFTIRYFNWREFISILIGYATPLIFFGFYLFMNNRFEVITNEYILLFVKTDLEFKFQLIPFISFSVFAFISLVTIFSVAGRVRMRKISTRKYFGLFLWLLLLSAIFFVLIPAAGLSTISFVALALSIIMSLFYVDVRNEIWGEVSFTLFIFSIISLVIFLQ